MKKLLAMLLFASITPAFAGGILTNTNQSINFLRNPARDAAIGLDGVYSNPAGVAFMPEGLHIGFNWQYASQTRTIEQTNELFKLGYRNNDSDLKTFKGEAKAPFLPSLQIAYNKGRDSYQLNLSVPGGGGKCEFNDGIGSFETMIGAITRTLQNTSSQLQAQTISAPNVTKYDADGYMKGRQYYFGLQLGVAHKFGDNLSGYIGLRLLYGTASYEARVNNIRVMNGDEGITLAGYFAKVTEGFAAKQAEITGGVAAYKQNFMSQGLTEEQAMQQPQIQNLLYLGQQLQEKATELEQKAAPLLPYTNGVNLKSDQTGIGLAPVIGLDYQSGDFNFALKYEFRTRMRMKNNSTLKEANMIPATNKFVDGTKVPEDSPAQLALGVQYKLRDDVRLNAGYHHFYDKSAHWYEHSEKLLDHGTNEYLLGAEWDAIDKLTVSAGGQLTRYGLTDDYMNDMSFVVSSYSFGLGLQYQLTDKVKVGAAYFQTNYGHYDKTTPEQANPTLGLTIPEGKQSFTRTNKVLGVNVEVSL